METRAHEIVNSESHHHRGSSILIYFFLADPDTIEHTEEELRDELIKNAQLVAQNGFNVLFWMIDKCAAE